MSRRSVDEVESRVLILAPTGRDGALARKVLEASEIHARICSDADDLRLEIQHGAGAILLTEEALNPRTLEEFAEIFATQLPWSDLPILIFSSQETKGESILFATRQLGSLANVILLDRPTRKVTLVSAARSALRARRRQYEVRDLLSELERGVRDRDQFLAMLGHELRNPLGAILTSVQLMERKDARALARERTVILRQTRLLSRLVDDLLDVSRVTSGKISLERAAVDLRELVERCVQGHLVTAVARRIDLEFSAANPIVAMCDTIRLEQVVNNLLTNALKYTPAGGHVRATLALEADEAEIRVEDTGVGIDPEALSHIFDPFTQAEETLDRAQGGLGIGLTLVKSLVRLHGGSVRAESPGKGEGSTFIVRIPAATRDLSVELPRTETQAQCAPRLILLVEDNADVREGLQRLLQACGHEVVTAADGEDGIRVAIARRPAIALVDIGLPKVDGYAVARRVREALGTEILLVALTGYGLPGDRTRAAEAGFDEHLTKPITLNAILELLARAQASKSKSPDADGAVAANSSRRRANEK